MRDVKVIVYNPKLVSKKDLPKTHKDLANPKYKGKFTQPPWTAHWAIAPAVFDNFDKQEWLQIVRQAGKNTGAVLYSSLELKKGDQISMEIPSSHICVFDR